MNPYPYQYRSSLKKKKKKKKTSYSKSTTDLVNFQTDILGFKVHTM